MTTNWKADRIIWPYVGTEPPQNGTAAFAKIESFLVSGDGLSMSSSDLEMYEVVVNIEGQYSIWAAAKAVPAGWDKAGYSGSKDACLAFIRDNWTDMRPLSLRAAMDGQAA